MSKIAGTASSIKNMDEMAEKDSFIHRIHPAVKLITALSYIALVVSYPRTDMIGLLLMFLYPVITAQLADIPLSFLLKRLIIIEPFIILVAIFNPLFDKQFINVAGVFLSAGWLTFLTILLKSTLTISAALLLFASTGIYRLAYAMRKMKIPTLFVLQILLTYRYIVVLLEEAGTLLTAYSLRAPRQKGVQRSAWGSLAGQLLLRTYDRAQRVYQAMLLRGFDGDYPEGIFRRLRTADIFFLVGWMVFLLLARYGNVPQWLGTLLTGGSF